MNFKLSKSDEKGGEEISLTISPSDNLEREFFNAMFANNGVKVEAVPNSEQVVIKKIVKPEPNEK